MADIERWGNPASYDPVWSKRSQLIAGFLSGCTSVCDLGAGTQTLRPMVKGQYIPVDVVSLGPDTVTVNFDEPWDTQDIPVAEGYAIAGLLEHVRDPLGVIAGLAPLGRVWAVSYMDRVSLHGRPLLKLRELVRACQRAGMKVDRWVDWKGQRVYRMVRC